MKLYTKNANAKRLQPKKETIQFLLNYSKSFKIVKTKTDFFIKLHLN
jgi:hypothetical protein